MGSIYNLVLRHTFSVQLINVFFVCLFVCVPPLGLLGVISSFLFIIEKVCIIFGVSVFNFCEVGFDSPTNLVSGDPHVLW